MWTTSTGTSARVSTISGPWRIFCWSACPGACGSWGSTLALSLLLGVALALLCVRRPWADRALYPVLSALAEVPPFLTGVLLLFLVAARAAWIPLSGAYTPFAQYDGLWQRLGTSWCTA